MFVRVAATEYNLVGHHPSSPPPVSSRPLPSPPLPSLFSPPLPSPLPSPPPPPPLSLYVHLKKYLHLSVWLLMETPWAAAPRQIQHTKKQTSVYIDRGGASSSSSSSRKKGLLRPFRTPGVGFLRSGNPRGAQRTPKVFFACRFGGAYKVVERFRLHVFSPCVPSGGRAVTVGRAVPKQWSRVVVRNS